MLFRSNVLNRTRERLRDVLAGYVGRPEVTLPNDAYVVAPRFGQDAGLVGAIALAEAAVGSGR